MPDKSAEYKNDLHDGSTLLTWARVFVAGLCHGARTVASSPSVPGRSRDSPGHYLGSTAADPVARTLAKWAPYAVH